jgi:DNA-binding CsgD family transcriptional regulator
MVEEAPVVVQDTAARLHALLGELLACGEPLDDVSPAAGAVVVLDVALDGCRYQLLRAPPRELEPVSLSSRELEIARMIANGHTNRTIAVVLEISPWTVSTHLRRVFAKLDVSSRAAMVGELVAAGLITARAREPGTNSNGRMQRFGATPA